MSPSPTSSSPPDPVWEATAFQMPVLAVLRRYTLIYIVVALAWVFGTDLLVAWIATDLSDAIWFSVAKGTLFVAVTAWILHAGTRRTLVEWDRRTSLFRAVVEEAPDLIARLRLRPTLSFDYVSPASTGVGGYMPEEFYEDPELILRTVHPDDANTLRRILTTPSADEESFTLRWIHKDDASTVWTDVRITWEYDASGQPTAAVAVVRDMTPQHEAESSVRLLATAIEAAGEAVMVTDAEGVIEYVNPSFERLSGYPAEEAVGRTPRILRSGRQSKSFYARLWSTLRRGGSFRGHFVNRRKDGTLYEQQSTITPVLDDTGRTTHFVAVSRDVTVDREIHRQIAASEKAAAVAQLAAGLAHDFRNLLNVVLVNTEMLETACADTPEVHGQIADIQGAVGAGSDLVTRLLGIARPSPTKERTVVDLNRVVKDMEGLLRAAVARSVEFVLEVTDGEVPVRIERLQIEQALLNLVRNASQAMPDGGTLTVAVGRADEALDGAEPPAGADGPFARLVVADTGEGLDAESLARVYDPFFTTKETGTGLGVPMVQRAVQEHGGVMRFDSAPGSGTTVTVHLPLTAEQPSSATTEEPVALAPSASRGEKILLVDDDDSLRRAAERALTGMGYTVTTASNGLEAIRLIETGEHWDLLLTDMVMPGLGGAELYERLEERGIGLNAIFMSGQSPEVIDGFNTGRTTTGFLPKPWTLQSLANKVREALDLE